MYANWPINLLVVFATSVLVALVVLMHYEGLGLLSGWLVRVKTPRRRKVLLGVYGVILVHILEIMLFGVTIWGLLVLVPDAGSLGGQVDSRFLDSIYLSASSYTTVGFGDVAPLGPIRFITSSEALIGLILITWSASFLYLEMDQYWHRRFGE
jgi:hypothetical protein